MPNTTLAQLRTSIRQRTGYETSQFFTDSELNTYINEGMLETYEAIVNAYEDFYSSFADTVLSSGNTFAVPTDFYKLRAVDLVVAANQYTTLRPFSFAERNNMGERSYRLMGQTLYINPYTTAAPNTYRLWYIPRVTPLAVDADQLGPDVDQWRELIVMLVCITMAMKDEGTDTNPLVERKNSIMRRISESAARRDVGYPDTIANVRSGQGITRSGLRWENDY